MPKDRKITRENRKKGRQEDGGGNPVHNTSHLPDPTAHDAIAKADKRDQQKKGMEKK